MGNKITVYSSVLSDIYELIPKLRADDIREIEALNLTPEQSLLRGYIFSDFCYTAKHKGKIIGMFGLSGYTLKDGAGSIWFLGSDEMTKHPIAFVKGGKKYINKFLTKYNILENAVDCRNTTHINWLKKIGAIMTDKILLNGYEFWRFYFIKEGEHYV